VLFEPKHFRKQLFCNLKLFLPFFGFKKEFKFVQMVFKKEVETKQKGLKVIESPEKVIESH